MLEDKNMLNLESHASKFIEEFKYERTDMILIRNGTVIDKIAAKTTELRDDKRAIAKNLSVQSLSIRLEYCFSPSNDSQRMRVCRKTN